VICALFGFFLLAFFSQKKKSITIDEFAHLPAGYYYLKTRDFQLYAKNPPLVKMLLALPWLWEKPSWERDLSRFPRTAWRPWFYGTDFMLKNKARYLALFEKGRAVEIFLGVLLGASLYWFSRRYYGKKGALISLLVFCLSPNLLAHSRIATPDVGFGLFMFLAIFSLLEYLKKPGWSRAIISGFFLGLAQLGKFTALLILPFYLLAPALALVFSSQRRTGKDLLKRAGELVIILLVMCLIICAGYGFKGIFKKTAEYQFHSQRLKKLQKIFAPLPAPFPRLYLYGLDAQMLDAERGEFANYLLGRWYRGTSKKYFLIALLVKVPIPVQLLFIWGLALGIFRKKARWKKEEIFILAVLVWVFVLFSIKSVLQIGIRYLVPFFPLAFFLLGRLGEVVFSSRAQRLIVFGLFAWLLLETLWIYPDYLAYFNQLCGGAKNGHKVLLDSNLDWGQDLPGLKEFMRKNQIAKIELAYFGHALPELYGIEYQVLGKEPRLKYSAISLQLLLGAGYFYYPLLYHQPEQTLKEFEMPVIVPAQILKSYLKKKPLARCGYSIWIFEND